MGEIPSAEYPFAQEFWPVHAVQDCVWRTATTSGNAFFLNAIEWRVITAGAVFGVASFAVVSFLQLPVLILYGIIGGLAAMKPGRGFIMMIGACLGRYYFSPRFGRERWRRYTYVLSAGFTCGFGLGSLAPIAVRLIAAAISHMPY
jgi:hypothetical protein